MRNRIIRNVVLGGLAVHVAGAVAWAQTQPRLPDEEQTWFKWAIAGGLAVVVCVAGFLNTKRSHLT